MSIAPEEIVEALRLKQGGNLFHREGQTLEFKESFNFAGLAEYYRDFAAFANNKGGYLIFGVKDQPRRASGMSTKSLDLFERIDPEKISGDLIEIFSGHIEWEQEIHEVRGKQFGVFRVLEAKNKPIIAKKDEGKESSIRNGDIYFRYGGRTQRIQHPELATIIERRIKQNNDAWLDLVTKIGAAGPSNAAILDTEKGLLEKGDTQIMVLDEDLVKKLKFIKEGEFTERKGATALKLVGDVQPAKQVEVVKHVKENLLRDYPLTATELHTEVKKRVPTCKQNDVWDVMRENKIKENKDYSVYNFRSKAHADHYTTTGQIKSGTPSIYKPDAVEFIVNILKQGK